MRYNGIIFDLDGTLADTLADIAGSMNTVLLSHGYPEKPVADYKLLVGRGLDNLVNQSLPENARTKQNVTICLDEFMTHYQSNCLVKTHLYEGITEMLGRLLNLQIKIAVFSNKADALTVMIVQKLLPNLPFVEVMGAKPDFPKKPHPEGALFVARKMDIQPSNMIYVGDSDVDMITATKAGMVAVGVSWGFRSREELFQNGASIVIDKPDQLLTVL